MRWLDAIHFAFKYVIAPSRQWLTRAAHTRSEVTHGVECGVDLPFELIGRKLGDGDRVAKKLGVSDVIADRLTATVREGGND